MESGLFSLFVMLFIDKGKPCFMAGFDKSRDESDCTTKGFFLTTNFTTKEHQGFFVILWAPLWYAFYHKEHKGIFTKEHQGAFFCYSVKWVSAIFLYPVLRRLTNEWPRPVSRKTGWVLTFLSTDPQPPKGAVTIVNWVIFTRFTDVFLSLWGRLGGGQQIKLN